MSITQLNHEAANQTPSRRFLLEIGISQLAVGLAYKLDGIREQSIKAQERLAEFSEAEWAAYDKAYTRYASGNTSDEIVEAISEISCLLDQKNRYTDAARMVTSQGGQVVSRMTRALPDFSNIINIGDRTYWLDVDSHSPTVVTSDPFGDAVIYFAQKPAMPGEVRPAVPGDYAELLTGISGAQNLEGVVYL